MNYKRFKPRRSAARWLIGAPEHVVAVYDAGPRFADRYTVVYGAPIWSENYARHSTDPRLVPARAMSENPYSPQGVGLFIDVLRGPHLGRKIAWGALPLKCQECVIEDGVMD